MMPLQRARGAESRVRNKLSNGPLRVQGNVGEQLTEYSATCWHTSVAEDMFVSCKGHENSCSQGGTADKIFYSSLTERRFLSRAFLFA